MLRNAMLSVIVLACTSPLMAGDAVSGTYVEARTCQVYTGPCFANGEVGSAGKEAIMTWQIEDGSFSGVDLAGQSVAVVVKASHTLGFKGFEDAKSTKAIVIVDSQADEQKAAALQQFALHQTGIDAGNVAGVHRSDIEMQFDMDKLTAEVKVGDFAHLVTRKARKGDCICSNESAYYPPLTELQGFVPGVTIEGDVTARRLGMRWSIPDSRTAYLGTFEVDHANPKLVSSK